MTAYRDMYKNREAEEGQDNRPCLRTERLNCTSLRGPVCPRNYQETIWSKFKTIFLQVNSTTPIFLWTYEGKSETNTFLYYVNYVSVLHLYKVQKLFKQMLLSIYFSSPNAENRKMQSHAAWTENKSLRIHTLALPLLWIALLVKCVGFLKCKMKTDMIKTNGINTFSD